MDTVPGQTNNHEHGDADRVAAARAKANQALRHNKDEKSKFKPIAIIVGVVVVIAIVIFGYFFFNQSNTGASIEGDKYQAVFFTNGQVYFGKLHMMNSDYMKLTDIFYLQAKTDTTNPQKTTDQSATGVELIKLGNEIHGPEDQMVISKSQVLFFENLKNDSKVSSTIINYQKK